MYNWLVKKFQGRSTTFIIVAFISGTVLSIFHRLDGNLVALYLGLGGLVVGHSVKEDLLSN